MASDYYAQQKAQYKSYYLSLSQLKAKQYAKEPLTKRQYKDISYLERHIKYVAPRETGYNTGGEGGNWVSTGTTWKWDKGEREALEAKSAEMSYQVALKQSKKASVYWEKSPYYEDAFREMWEKDSGGLRSKYALKQYTVQTGFGGEGGDEYGTEWSVKGETSKDARTRYAVQVAEKAQKKLTEDVNLMYKAGVERKISASAVNRGVAYTGTVQDEELQAARKRYTRLGARVPVGTPTQVRQAPLTRQSTYLTGTGTQSRLGSTVGVRRRTIIGEER